MLHKSPLANKLLKITFSLYFIVAITVTTLHIVAEYTQTRQRIYSEMSVILQSHQTNLSQSLWDYDMEQINAISNGLLEFSSIEGVKIKNFQGENVLELGLLTNEENETYEVDSLGQRQLSQVNLGLFSTTTPIIYHVYNQQENLGHITLYSSKNAVVKRVKLGFYFIIGNAIIKTLALWIIIYWVFSRIIGKPLAIATQFIKEVELNDIKGCQANWEIKDENEIKLLENAFNKMLSNHQKKEIELNTSRNKNKELKYYLDNLIDSMPSILIGLDQHNNITLWNRQAEKETQKLSKNVVGNSVLSASSTLNISQEKIRLCNLNKSVMKDEQIELRNQYGRRFIDITYYPLTDGQTKGVVIRIDDVTQRIELSELQLNNQQSEIREQEQLHYQEEIEDNNRQLQLTLENLKDTQKQLVQSEKMASLGRLVAGVAHEINTPLGNAVLGISSLDDSVNIIQKKYKEKTMAESDFNSFLTAVPPIVDIITVSLSKVASLIKSFKLVSVDQDRFEEKIFNVSEMITILLENFNQEFQDYQLEINIDGQKDVSIRSYPEAFFQILNQLVNNSLIHAFKLSKKGNIDFNLNIDSQFFTLTYGDNGQGISQEDMQYIFDPFFTTGRAQGSIGLGLHVVFNLVQHVLQGTIKCQSTYEHGTRFTIHIPLPTET